MTELEAIQKDAARYRMLRDKGAGDHAVLNGELACGEELDRIIDKLIVADLGGYLDDLDPYTLERRLVR